MGWEDGNSNGNGGGQRPLFQTKASTTTSISSTRDGGGGGISCDYSSAASDGDESVGTSRGGGAPVVLVDDGVPSNDIAKDLQRVLALINDERHLVAYDLYKDAKNRYDLTESAPRNMEDARKAGIIPDQRHKSPLRPIGGSGPSNATLTNAKGIAATGGDHRGGTNGRRNPILDYWMERNHMEGSSVQHGAANTINNPRAAYSPYRAANINNTTTSEPQGMKISNETNDPISAATAAAQAALSNQLSTTTNTVTPQATTTQQQQHSNGDIYALPPQAPQDTDAASTTSFANKFLATLSPSALLSKRKTTEFGTPDRNGADGERKNDSNSSSTPSPNKRYFRKADKPDLVNGHQTSIPVPGDDSASLRSNGGPRLNEIPTPSRYDATRRTISEILESVDKGGREHYNDEEKEEEDEIPVSSIHPQRHSDVEISPYYDKSTLIMDSDFEMRVTKTDAPVRPDLPLPLATNQSSQQESQQQQTLLQNLSPTKSVPQSVLSILQRKWSDHATTRTTASNTMDANGSSAIPKMPHDDGYDIKLHMMEAARYIQEMNTMKFISLCKRAKQFQEAKESLTVDDDWTLAQTLFGVTTQYRREPDGTLSIKLLGELSGVPLFEQLAVLRECDLYHLWAPFCKSSRKLAQLGKLECVGWYKIHIPAMLAGGTRHGIFHSMGCDTMREDGSIMIVGKEVRTIQQQQPQATTTTTTAVPINSPKRAATTHNGIQPEQSNITKQEQAERQEDIPSPSLCSEEHSMDGTALQELSVKSNGAEIGEPITPKTPSNSEAKKKNKKKIVFKWSPTSCKSSSVIDGEGTTTSVTNESRPGGGEGDSSLPHEGTDEDMSLQDGAFPSVVAKEEQKHHKHKNEKAFIAIDDHPNIEVPTYILEKLGTNYGNSRAMTIRKFYCTMDVMGPSSARTRIVINIDPNINHPSRRGSNASYNNGGGQQGTGTGGGSSSSSVQIPLIPMTIPQNIVDLYTRRVAGVFLLKLQAAARKIIQDPRHNAHARRMRIDTAFYQNWLLPKFHMYCDELGWDMPRVSAFDVKRRRELTDDHYFSDGDLLYLTDDDDYYDDSNNNLDGDNDDDYELDDEEELELDQAVSGDKNAGFRRSRLEREANKKHTKKQSALKALVPTSVDKQVKSIQRKIDNGPEFLNVIKSDRALEFQKKKQIAAAKRKARRRLRAKPLNSAQRQRYNELEKTKRLLESKEKHAEREQREREGGGGAINHHYRRAAADGVLADNPDDDAPNDDRRGDIDRALDRDDDDDDFDNEYDRSFNFNDENDEISREFRDDHDGRSITSRGRRRKKRKWSFDSFMFQFWNFADDLYWSAIWPVIGNVTLMFFAFYAVDGFICSKSYYIRHFEETYNVLWTVLWMSLYYVVHVHVLLTTCSVAFDAVEPHLSISTTGGEENFAKNSWKRRTTWLYCKCRRCYTRR